MTLPCPILALIVGLAPFGATVLSQPAPAASPTPGVAETVATHLRIEIDPLVELYFSVRAQAARTDTPALAGQEHAVAAARAIQKSLGAFGGWGPLDSEVFTARDPVTLRRRFEALPETMKRFGREISVREDAIDLAKALEVALPRFLEATWPGRRETLQAIIESLGARFLPDHTRALAHMMVSLGVADPAIEVPVFLVIECHPPGASTYYLANGEPAMVLGAFALHEKGVLEETILHESTHALDIASKGRGSVFETLRGLLAERGVKPEDRLYQELPHTLMFVQAAETMRRIYDPNHVAYGEATDLYQRLGKTAEVERRIWPRVLDAELPRQDALLQIVAELVPSAPAPR